MQNGPDCAPGTGAFTGDFQAQMGVLYGSQILGRSFRKGNMGEGSA